MFNHSRELMIISHENMWCKLWKLIVWGNILKDFHWLKLFTTLYYYNVYLYIFFLILQPKILSVHYEGYPDQRHNFCFFRACVRGQHLCNPFSTNSCNWQEIWLSTGTGLWYYIQRADFFLPPFTLENRHYHLYKVSVWPNLKTTTKHVI
jgi:hypothetical protein